VLAPTRHTLARPSCAAGARRSVTRPAPARQAAGAAHGRPGMHVRAAQRPAPTSWATE